MTWLIIPALCLLAVAKIALQSDFSKSGNADIGNNILCNGIMFASAALILIPFILKRETTPQTLLFGVIMGILSFAFQIFYICAFSSGKMSLTVIINNFSMVLPMTVSFILFNEDFGFLNLIGTILALVSFVLTTSASKNEENTSNKSKTKWLFFTILVFLTNGMIAVNQKIYSAFSDKFQVFDFVATAYITASLSAAAALMILRHKTVKKRKSVLGVKYIITFCISGCILGLFQCLNTYAASVINGTVLYSTYNCGVSLLSVLAGRFIFKETISQKQFIGLVFGIIAIGMLCL